MGPSAGVGRVRRRYPLPRMALAQVLVVVVLLLAFALGVFYAMSHTREEVDSFLARSRVVTRVMLQVAVALLAVGLVGLAAARAL